MSEIIFEKNYYNGQKYLASQINKNFWKKKTENKEKFFKK